MVKRGKRFSILAKLGKWLTAFDVLLHETMRNIPFGLFFREFLFQPGHIAVILWGITVLFFKEGTEGAETFEADTIADFSNAQSFPFEQDPGMIESFLCEVLMRCLAIDPGEQAMEVKT